jgi:hypothetical protein
MEFQVCKYKKEWAIFARTSRCYVLFGTKKQMEIRCRELNNGN